MAGGPSEASIFNMASALEMSQDLNACQSARKMVMEADDAFISVKYWSLSSSGSSWRVCSNGLIVLVYLSTYMRSWWALSIRQCTSSCAILECWNHWFSLSCSWSTHFLSITICCCSRSIVEVLCNLYSSIRPSLDFVSCWYTSP